MKLMLKPRFFAGWRWQHWLLIILVLSVAGYEMVDRQFKRLQTYNNTSLDHIERSIAEYNTLAEQLASMEKLPPVKTQWNYVSAIANTYGVNMKLQGKKGASNYYTGPLDAWNGNLDGYVTAVLVTARKMQQTVPVHFYGFNIANEKMTLSFSVLGSSDI